MITEASDPCAIFWERQRHSIQPLIDRVSFDDAIETVSKRGPCESPHELLECANVWDGRRIGYRLDSNLRLITWKILFEAFERHRGPIAIKALHGSTPSARL